MKIVYTGGGTLGSVTPLLAVHEELACDGFEAHWIGTRQGPERALVERAGIPFTVIATGKIRRYLHWRNLVDPFLLIIGFVQAMVFLVRTRPRVIVNAGSFVGVPVVIAGWFLGVPAVILQLDIDPVRSNLLTAPFARALCVAAEECAQYFPKEKITVTGIPVRKMVSRPNFAKHHETSQNLDVTVSSILVTGGGTGAQKLNDLVFQSISRLTEKTDVIHLTGKNKEGESAQLARSNPRYHPAAFEGDTLSMFMDVDVVVTRAGMGTLAELSALRKPVIIIPIPHSPQEKNAAFAAQHNAARILSEENLTPDAFVHAILDLLSNREVRNALSKNIATLFPSDAATRVARIIRNIV